MGAKLEAAGRCLCSQGIGTWSLYNLFLSPLLYAHSRGCLSDMSLKMEGFTPKVHTRNPGSWLPGRWGKGASSPPCKCYSHRKPDVPGSAVKLLSTLSLWRASLGSILERKETWEWSFGHCKSCKFVFTTVLDEGCYACGLFLLNCAVNLKLL
jgi:hypothetical protein